MEHIVKILESAGVENAKELVAAKPETVNVDDAIKKARETLRVRLQSSEDPYYADIRKEYKANALAQITPEFSNAVAVTFGLSPEEAKGKTIEEMAKIYISRNGNDKDEVVRKALEDQKAARTELEHFKTVVVPEAKSQASQMVVEMQKERLVEREMIDLKIENATDMLPALVAKMQRHLRLELDAASGTIVLKTLTGATLLNENETKNATLSDVVKKYAQELNLLPKSNPTGGGGNPTPGGNPNPAPGAFPPGTPTPLETGVLGGGVKIGPGHGLSKSQQYLAWLQNNPGVPFPGI